MKIGIVAPFNPMSIADCLDENNIPSINTSATAVNTLVSEFLLQGHHVVIFTLTTQLPQKYCVLKGKGVSVHLVPSGLAPRVFGVRQFVLGQFYLPARLKNTIRKEINNIDVLHAHWTYEYAKAASKLSDLIPVFDTVRDWCPYQLSIMKGKKKIDWFLKYLTFKEVMNNSNITFIANSCYTQQMIIRAFPKKIVPIIHNPIDKKWILSHKKCEVKHKIVSIASGLCSPRKNIGKLLEAFAKYRELHPEAQLHLVGNYDQTSENYKEWKLKGWFDGVFFHGSMAHEQLAALLDEMTFMVHPSWEETFGNILLEAMSRGVPCIGGEDSGAVPDVLGHGKYGLICDIRNAQSILEAMEKMGDIETYTTIQNQATTMLKETYSSDVIVRRHIEIFEKAIAQRN